MLAPIQNVLPFTDYLFAPQALKPLRAKNIFHSRIRAFFQGKLSTDLEPYLYMEADPLVPGDMVCSNKLYAQIVKSSQDYYLVRNEAYIIQRHKNCISKVVGDGKIVIELGPGTETSVEKKTLPFLAGLRAPAGYFPLDLCPTALRSAMQIVGGVYPGMYMEGYQLDFYENVKVLPQLESPVVFFPGGTIGNIPEDFSTYFPFESTRRLQHLGNLAKDGFLVIGLDTNQDEKSLLAAYDTPEFHQYALNIFHLIKRDLNVQNFDPTAFQILTQWHPDHHCLATYAIATREQEITLEGERLHIPKNHKMHICSSYKFPHHVFQKMAHMAGLRVVEYFTDGEDKMAVYVLRSAK